MKHEIKQILTHFRNNNVDIDETIEAIISLKNLGESSSRLSAVSGCDEGWISCADRLPDIKENIKYDVWHIQKGRLINCDFCIRDDPSNEKYFRTNISNVVLTLDFITFWRLAPKSPHHGR